MVVCTGKIKPLDFSNSHDNDKKSDIEEIQEQTLKVF